MTMPHITYMSIYYAGVCSGLLLFALMLAIVLSGSLWSSSKASAAVICRWASQKNRYILIFIVACGAALLTMGLVFREPARPVLPEPPQNGRYLLLDGLERIAEFNSKADCQFAKNSIWANYLQGKNLGERLNCVYLGKGLAMP